MIGKVSQFQIYDKCSTCTVKLEEQLRYLYNKVLYQVWYSYGYKIIALVMVAVTVLTLQSYQVMETVMIFEW